MLEKFFDKLNKKLFPNRKKQQDKEVQEIMKLSNSKLNFNESFNVLLGTSALFSVAEDKSESRMIEYINKKANQKLNNEEAKAILNFITSKFFTKDERLKVSKKEFANTLNLWLSKRLNNNAIEETAKSIGFKMKNDEDFNKISNELFFVNMWLVVFACENEFKDENKRNECLDIFHRLVYSGLKKKERNFSDWMQTLKAKYIQYNKVMETEHQATPLWVLTKLISENLFGEFKLSSNLITAQITFSIEQLRKIINRFDVE